MFENIINFKNVFLFYWTVKFNLIETNFCWNILCAGCTKTFCEIIDAKYFSNSLSELIKFRLTVEEGFESIVKIQEQPFLTMFYCSHDGYRWFFSRRNVKYLCKHLNNTKWVVAKKKQAK